jgi:hypothetical protein
MLSRIISRAIQNSTAPGLDFRPILAFQKFGMTHIFDFQKETQSHFQVKFFSQRLIRFRPIVVRFILNDQLILLKWLVF